jgi:lysophospholipase L1-like esterase
MRWFSAPRQRKNKSGLPSNTGKKLTVEPLEERCLLSAGLDANENFIRALYQDDLGRPGTVAELDSWLPALVTSGLQAAVNGIENSAEARTYLVDGFYTAFLGRPAANGEEQSFVTLLENGNSQESVMSAILGSQEFFQHAPQVTGVGGGTATKDTFVEALFQLLLHRAPSSDELNQFSNTILSRSGRPGVAEFILGSPEYRTDVIQDFYMDGLPGTVLHRHSPPTANEVSVLVHSSLGIGDIHRDLETSLEKYALGYTSLDANQRYIQTIYQDALGRAGSVPELTYWEQQILTSGLGTAVQGIDQSQEARLHLVNSWYVTFLGRNPSGGEQQSWVSALMNNTPEEQVLSAIVGSQEYFNRSPVNAGVSGNTATNQTFIQALFQQLLNRAPTGDELNNFTETLLPRLGQQGVAAFILGSPEFRTDAIGAFYRSILQRSTAPTDAEVNGWVTSGLRLWTVEGAFQSSYEAFAAHPQIVAMGDSITDLYSKYTGNDPSTGKPLWGASGDRSWVEELQNLRAGSVAIADEAHARASSSDLLIQGQDTSAAALVQNGSVNYAVLIVGSNDIANFVSLAQAAGGTADPTPFISTLLINIQTALDRLKNAGMVNVVIANIPNIGQTPEMQAAIGSNTALAGLITSAVISANQRIEAFAAARGIPVVDLYGLENLAQTGLALGGQNVSSFFAPDGFNPNSIVQGLLANSILQAAHDAYGLNITGLRLSDQEILQPNTPPGGTLTYTDVSGFVQFNTTVQAPPFLNIFGMS